MSQQGFDFIGAFHFDPKSSAVAPSPHLEARETSALAAFENAQLGRKATQNARVLTLLKAAGATGLSDLELHRATGYPRQTLCLRRYDLRALLEPAGRYQDEHTKRQYTRWRVKNIETLS